MIERTRFLLTANVALLGGTILSCNPEPPGASSRGDGAMKAAEAPHPVSLEDVLRVRRFEAIVLSPDGERVAFVLREPNVEQDLNEFVVYELPIPPLAQEGLPAFLPERAKGKELLRTRAFEFQPERIDLQWTADWNSLLLLHLPSGEPRPILSRMSPATGQHEVVFRGDLCETEFAPDRSGKRLLIAGTVPDTQRVDRFDTTCGVRITENDYLADLRSDVENQRGLRPERHGQPELRLIERRGREVLVGRFQATSLALSPDGRHAIFSASAADVGTTLAPSFEGQATVGASDQDISVPVLVELPAKLELASAPIITPKNPSPWPLRIAVSYPSGKLEILRRDSDGAENTIWPIERILTTTPGVIRGTPELTAIAGNLVVGLGQTTMVPPDLYALDLATGAKAVFSEINPELHSQRLGRVETIEWSDDRGRYFGHIIYPVGYQPGIRYPCAILARSWDRDSFIYENEDGYRAGNFPAQLLAARGILVFMSANPMGAAGTYSGLWVRGKPVEYFWFVDGAHTLERPSERAASMQRVVDWFRFWLQEYERPSVPEDPEQYARWRTLHEQHERNERWIAEGKDPAAEHWKAAREAR